MPIRTMFCDKAKASFNLEKTAKEGKEKHIKPTM
jgi:hypothetical protein